MAENRHPVAFTTDLERTQEVYRTAQAEGKTALLDMKGKGNKFEEWWKKLFPSVPCPEKTTRANLKKEAKAALGLVRKWTDEKMVQAATMLVHESLDDGWTFDDITSALRKFVPEKQNGQPSLEDAWQAAEQEKKAAMVKAFLANLSPAEKKIYLVK